MALKHLLGLVSVALTVQAQSSSTATACPSSIVPLHGAPSVAPGFRVQVVANNLRNPRGLQFDSAGGLLVVERGHGIIRIPLTGDGACVRQNGPIATVVDHNNMTHGIALSQDGRTLYGSTPSNVYAWPYDAQEGGITGNSKNIIEGMGSKKSHDTRTLLLSNKVPSLLLVSRGSVGNIDLQTLDATTGVSAIKAFNISNMTDSAYHHARDGLLLGWGLRNSVGIGEDPVSGNIYSVENSVDDIQRKGQIFNQNNPGEEVNFHGSLNGTRTNVQGGNYGYPSCFAAWKVDEIPDGEALQVGSQFGIDEQNTTVDDTFCAQNRIAPRITLQPHVAPLDIKFNPNGTATWVTFHGSWDRDEPLGYQLSFIEFDGKGSPRAPSNSTTAAIGVVSNSDLSACPDRCFRPVALAWDAKGRLFMSSDTTGEIYVITKSDGSGVADVDQVGSSTGPGPPTGAAPSPSVSNSQAGKLLENMGREYWAVGAAVAGALIWGRI